MTYGSKRLEWPMTAFKSIFTRIKLFRGNVNVVKPD